MDNYDLIRRFERINKRLAENEMTISTLKHEIIMLKKEDGYIKNMIHTNSPG